MRIALVFNPFKYKLHEENIRIVQKYFGLFPPLSLTWVAAIAEQHGHESLIVDARTLGLSVDETIRRLKKFQPDIVGFMMTTYMFQETLSWIRAIKGALGVPVVVGGFNLRIYPEESVTPPEIDFGVVEHALDTLPGLLAQLEGGRNFENVPGLLWKEDGKIRRTETEPVSFEAFPKPLKRDLPNDLYAEFPTERKNFTLMVTSLGCPFNCRFCEAAGYPYNPRRPQTVGDEIEQCYREHGVREVDIFDYEFTVDRQRVAGICDEIGRRDLDLIWACRSRVTSVDEALIRQMANAGCRRIYYGIETGEDEMLADLRKGISVKQIRETLTLTRKHGIKSLGFFLVAVPGETAKSVRRMVRFAGSLPLDYAQFSKLTAKPGSELWHDLKNDHDDYWREYILGRANEHELERPWTRLTNDDVNRLTKEAYLRFYTRPGYLLRQVLNVRMWGEFKRKALALLDMLFSQEKRATADEHFRAYQENPRRRLATYQRPD